MDKYTDEQLKQELARRQNSKRELEKPKQLNQINVFELVKVCQSYIDSIADGTYHDDDDTKHYIFECAVETVFGKDVWKYINSRRE